MEFHLGGLGVRRLWLLLNILALHDITRLGIVALADDFGMCVPDSDSEISANIGDILSLSCLTDIELPRNRLTWFKNDDAIGDDDRIIITSHRVPCTLETGEGSDENCDSLQLSILNITKDDEGLYICRGTQRENGTFFVRVVEGTPTTTSTLAGTTLMTPLLTKPTCSSNMSSEDVLLLSDNVTFTCMTDMYTFSAGSLDWQGHENIQTKDNNSYSTSLVIDVQTALTTQPLCHLSCDESVQNCQENGLSCQVPLVSVSPLEQEGDVGGNVSFTCEINLKNYTVDWFAPGETNFDQLDIQSLNDGRTSIFTILNLQPNQTGTLFCRVKKKNGAVIIGTPRAVRFEVASPPDTSSITGDTGRSLSGEQTAGPASPEPPTTGCVYLSRLDDIPSTSPLSPNLVIIIAVCGGVALIIVVTIIIGIVCCRRRNKEPAIDINPVMAFGDLSNDNPVNMDVHFNVYSQHEIVDEGASSSDILHLDSTRRVPSVIYGRSNGHTDRKSSFIPIKEDEVDVDERRKDDDDDEPGRKLSYFVENDVYVTYDSNA